MCRKEYGQICARAEGIQVILEFPAEPEPSRDGGNSRAGGFGPGSIGHAPELPREGKNGRTVPDDREMARQEIKEILTGVLLESMEPHF